MCRWQSRQRVRTVSPFSTDSCLFAVLHSCCHCAAGLIACPVDCSAYLPCLHILRLVNDGSKWLKLRICKPPAVYFLLALVVDWDIVPALGHAVRRKTAQWRARRSAQQHGYQRLLGGADRGPQQAGVSAEAAAEAAEAGDVLPGEDEDVAAERRLVQSGTFDGCLYCTPQLRTLYRSPFSCAAFAFGAQCAGCQLAWRAKTHLQTPALHGSALMTNKLLHLAVQARSHGGGRCCWAGCQRPTVLAGGSRPRTRWPACGWASAAASASGCWGSTAPARPPPSASSQVLFRDPCRMAPLSPGMLGVFNLRALNTPRNTPAGCGECFKLPSRLPPFACSYVNAEVVACCEAGCCDIQTTANVLHSIC